MLIRFAVICFVSSLILYGCSSETPSSDATNTVVNNKVEKIEKASSPSLTSRVTMPPVSTSVPSTSNPEPVKQSIPTEPTRSELRVISEQVKINEDKAQDVIKQFDASLKSPELRNSTQAKFKQILPEYKKQMLQLGKAKLKEASLK